MSLIKVDNVDYVYKNGQLAVKGVSLDIEKGESVAIVGQNGAGKTTMVKMLNGLLKPTNGDILYKGESILDKTTANLSRSIGYVFQNPDDQIFHDIVYEEIAFGPKNLKLPLDEARKNIKMAIEITNLEESINDHPYNLPYGIRKFVTIASVIAMDPEVIILDEPTAGQDADGIKLLEDIVDVLLKKGKTIIIITHDMDYVASNFQRTIVMTNKKKIFDGLTEEVFLNDDILEQANLEKPQITKLAKELGWDEYLISIDEFIKKFESEKQ